MELPAETIELLRDEALAARCREVIADQLSVLGRQMEDIQATRSPFPMFARKEAKEQFARSVRTTEQETVAVRQLQLQVQQIEAHLLPQLRHALESYLRQASPDFLQIQRGIDAVDRWSQRLGQLSDSLLAFARDVREVRQAEAGISRVRAIASVREVAQRIEAEELGLAKLARDVEFVLQNSTSGVRLPDLPELRRCAWVQRLAVLPPETTGPECTQVETETRRFLTDGLAAATGCAQSCREVCRTVSDCYLEHYWAQLRVFARENYATDFALERDLARLSARYVDAEIIRAQGQLTANPFIDHR
ncbi:MAG: hypothetical protein HZC55_16920 [Verrucomicrobia bacterium]|jgi:hypothetical protein|nr:hypothetical protein [Verrucomicrobiota bacterium]